MSQIIDQIFNEVCLDPRVKDGIFRLDEDEHISALRDHIQKLGVPVKDSISITNKMLEGKYPDRQTYRAQDGILVTFPSPQHKAKAMKENPGKYTDKDPFPKSTSTPDTTLPDQSENPPEPNIFSSPTVPPEQNMPASITQNGNVFGVEPAKGPDDSLGTPTSAVSPPSQPKTPEEVAAEKEIIKQMIRTDDTALTSNPPIPENCYKELLVLKEYAHSHGFSDANKFITTLLGL